MMPYFDLHHTVTDDEIDAQQHVHNLRYLQWTLWAARDHSAEGGWNAEAALTQGLGWVVREHDAVYRAAAVAGDRIVIRTWIEAVDRFASVRKYLICRPADRAVLARVETRWVLVDLHARRALAIPAEITRQMAICPKKPPLPWEPAG